MIDALMVVVLQLLGLRLTLTGNRKTQEPRTIKKTTSETQRLPRRQQVAYRELTMESNQVPISSGGEPSISTDFSRGSVSRIMPTDIKDRRDAGLLLPGPQSPKPISSSMLIDEVATHLCKHGCLDVTERIDLASAGYYPHAVGGYCDVFKIAIRPDKTLVAVKVRRVFGREEADCLKEAARELHIWSKCNHPNVMKLLGFAKFRDRIAIVSSWMAYGSLLKYLQARPEADRCKLATQVCEGLAYLHSRNIAHRDLKGPNILVSSDGTPAIIDFGNSTLKDSTMQFTGATGNAAGTLRWLAPEVLDGSGKHGMEADIYSLGMTILETVTGKIPYCDISDRIIHYVILVDKELPFRPNDTIPPDSEHGDQLWGLLMSCWSRKPKIRPSAEQTVQTMKTIKHESLKAGRQSI